MGEAARKNEGAGGAGSSSRGGSKKNNFELSASSSDLGQSDSLRNTVLSLVVERNYDRANRELDAFVEMKTEYPLFRSRVERYVSHCHDLISAIRAKKSFPGLSTLSMSKQQELHERSLQHFQELTNMLKTIEQVDKEMKLDDVRSTVWVIKAIMSSIIAVILILFAIEFSRSTVSSASIVLDKTVTDAVDGLFEKIGL